MNFHEVAAKAPGVYHTHTHTVHRHVKVKTGDKLKEAAATRDLLLAIPLLAISFPGSETLLLQKDTSIC